MDIRFSYARSGGPGGQNVNKVSSKAVAKINLSDAPLTQEQKERFIKLFPNNINKDGEITVCSQVYRDQPMNRRACIEKLEGMFERARFVPVERIPTKPTQASKEKRLAKKKLESRKKAMRGNRNWD